MLLDLLIANRMFSTIFNNSVSVTRRSVLCQLRSAVNYVSSYVVLLRVLLLCITEFYDIFTRSIVIVFVLHASDESAYFIFSVYAVSYTHLDVYKRQV